MSTPASAPLTTPRTTPLTTARGLAGIGGGERLFIALMRDWAALRTGGEPLLPVFRARAEVRGMNGHGAVAVDTMLCLTQSLLDRALQAETQASQRLGGDECAVLVLLDQGRFVRGAYAPRSIPHGLPGVLAWATLAVRQAFAAAGICLDATRPTQALCPFQRTPGQRTPGQRWQTD